jgi:hypothetical protein
MRRTAIRVALLLLAALAVVGAAPAGAAAHHFSVTVDHTAVHSGRQFTVTAVANTPCTWLVEWNGERRHTQARTFVTTFTAPAVTKRTTYALSARCFYSAAPATHRGSSARTAAGAPADAQTIVVRVPPSWARTIVITVLPAGAVVSPPHTGGGGGVGPDGLPGTGGPDRWILLAGLALLLTGATAVRRGARDGDAGGFTLPPSPPPFPG